MPRIPRSCYFSSGIAAVLAFGAVLIGMRVEAAPILPRSILKSFFQEGPGTTTSEPRACDTEILLTYTAGLAGMPSGSGTTTALYLYDTTGEPLTSGTGEIVCAPCLFENGGGLSAPRRTSILIDDLIVARGGFGTSSQVRQGFVVLDVTGDPVHLSALVRIRTTTGTPGQPTIVPITPRNVLETYLEIGAQPSLFVEPPVQENIVDWGVSDWAIYHGTYLGGIGGMPAGAGATLEVYWFNDDGTPSQGPPACAPCTYSLGNGGTTGAPRNVEIRFPSTPTSSGEGFAVFRVTGADPSAVVLERTDVDSIPGVVPTLLVTRGRVLEPLGPTTEVLSIHEPDVSGAALVLRGSPNPAAGSVTFAFDLGRATTVELDVFDAAGRRVASVESGARAAGHHELRWNRRDDSGSRLAAGVYYGRLRAGDGSRITRLVFLPE